jgi:ParB family chromosome partitioning protein
MSNSPKNPKKPSNTKSKSPAKAKPKSLTGKKASDRGLGRGLSALMSDVSAVSAETPAALAPAPMETQETTQPDVSDKRVQFLSIDRLERNPDQPRRHFDKDKLAELTNSIKAKGVLQPILVRPVPSAKNKAEHFQIVAGERRWQASLAAGLMIMPVLIRDLNDEEVLQIGVIENVQRADLNPIEEARAYDALISQFYRKQEEVADAIGKSRPYVTNMLRLLKLPEIAQDMLAIGKISTGHARCIISAPDPAALANEIAEKGLSVREAEDWVRRIKKSSGQTPTARKYKDADTQAAEKSLMDALGLQVDLSHKGPGGLMKISYKTSEQLEGLIQKLTNP